MQVMELRCCLGGEAHAETITNVTIIATGRKKHAIIHNRTGAYRMIRMMLGFSGEHLV